MSELTRQNVTVSARRGEKENRPAVLLSCSCGGGRFYIFVLGPDENHFHLQCAKCGESYCQGKGVCALE